MGERSSSTTGFPSLRPASGSWGYHSKSNVLTYPDEQKRSPRQIPLAYHSKRNDMSYNRTLSPGGRRMTNPARASDSSFDPYYSQRHSVYASPRASTDRVIPISTQTYLNPPATTSASTSSSRLAPGYDAYSGRPRRSSMLDNTRSGSTNPAPPRNRPTVVQGDIRPSSPPRQHRPDYYIQPASSKEPKRQFEHKKVYSVDDGSAKLVADVDLGSGGERHHRRRESSDRSGYNRSSGHDRGRTSYHPSGKSGKTLEDDNAFSYTDPASMYKDTEPRWRETRPRRGSVDRGGASRERPVSMIEPYADPRRSTRDIGPPPSQRGWDKIQDLGRTRSTRDPVPHSPSRGARERDESRGRYADSKDPYYIAPRKSSADRSRTQAIHQDRPTERYDSEYEDRREPRHHERRLSATRHTKDRSVSRRGFGVRADSTDRYGTRGSDDSFEARNRDVARDSGFARDVTADSQYPDRERKYTQEPKRKEHGRSYEDYDRDSDRDRPRKDRDADKDGYRERHHHRRDSERDEKKDSDNSFSGAAKIAAGGLGAAATLFGLNREKGKKEEREREREEREEQERLRQREHERPREHERRHDDRREREVVEPEKRRRGGGSNDDEPPVDRQRDPYVDPDRGLGFAFEGGEGNKPRDAPREPAVPSAPYDQAPPQPPRPQPRPYDREPTSDRDSDRPYEKKPSQAHAPPPTNDADEDYRRRMEQVQRELGLPAQDPSSDSDPDRERRRRERELRQAERQGRKANGHRSEAPSHYDHAPPSGGPRASFEDDASQAPSQSTWSSAPTNNGQQQELRRRASVLDSSMDAGLMAQVIDNSQSEKRENRVRIVDPPSEEDDKRPKGILKRPTEKFPENPDAVREGVAPLKDVCIALLSHSLAGLC
jgi:hypothetical protein